MLVFYSIFHFVCYYTYTPNSVHGHQVYVYQTTITVTWFIAYILYTCRNVDIKQLIIYVVEVILS